MINEVEYVNESLVMQSKGKLVAMVHLNMEQIEDKFSNLVHSAHDAGHDIQVKIEEILRELQEHVNAHVAKNSKLQLIMLQADPFEKTPTQKIKRFLYKEGL